MSKTTSVIKKKPRATHRGRIQIMYDILIYVSKRQDTEDGCIQQNIIYGATLNSNQAHKHIGFLLENELLEQLIINEPEYTRPLRLFRVTAKGFMFLQLYDEMHDKDIVISNK